MLNVIITGVCGQDGSYLAELLLSKGYNVIGVTRRSSTNQESANIKKCLQDKNFKLIYGDICDPTFIYRVIYDYRPHEFYNLAAESHVGQSFINPVKTFTTNATAVITQLDAIRQVSPSTRYYQASTSELFGGLSCPKEGYSESSSLNPRSPYAVAKLAAYWAVRNYRESYGLYACNGILHNHSSPRRGLDFATRKITHGVAAIKLGLKNKLKMGNLEPFRDEGHSKDFVRAMYLMLQQENPRDFVVATGDGATIREMLEYVCQLADLDFNQVYEQDPRYMRPSDVPYLLGNPSLAKNALGWEPEYNWKDLLKEMYLFDYHTA
jgi:GDPmannose 4,6-dehydratase